MAVDLRNNIGEKTLGGKTIGIIPGVFNLKLNIKFSEPSEISFDIPSVIDGTKNPFYDLVVGHRQIYTKHYGIYEILNRKQKRTAFPLSNTFTGFLMKRH